MTATSFAAQWSQFYPVNLSGRRTASSQSFSYLERALAARSAAAKDPLIYELHARLDQLAELGQDWDAHGSLAPDEFAIANARTLLEDLFQQSVEVAGAAAEVEGGTHWQRPHITANESGEVVFEWWNGDRKLTIYVGRDHTSYVKSWGPHVVEDMEDGVVTEAGVGLLWGWLFG